MDIKELMFSTWIVALAFAFLYGLVILARFLIAQNIFFESLVLLVFIFSIAHVYIELTHNKKKRKWWLE